MQVYIAADVRRPLGDLSMRENRLGVVSLFWGLRFVAPGMIRWDKRVTVGLTGSIEGKVAGLSPVFF